MGHLPIRSSSRKDNLPVRQRAYESIKARVLSGRYGPGVRLTEEHLAEELGVSRTPIREALHKLEQEGLITPLETRGFIVPRDSKEEMEELFELRAILEGFTLRLVSEFVSEEMLQKLGGYIEKAEEALRRERTDQIFKWNTQFHDTLHRLVAHKRRLHQMIVNIRKYALRYRKDTLHYLEGGKRSIEGHRKILLALRLRDPDLCERVMRDHIREAEEDAMKATSEES